MCFLLTVKNVSDRVDTYIHPSKRQCQLHKHEIRSLFLFHATIEIQTRWSHQVKASKTNLFSSQDLFYKDATIIFWPRPVQVFLIVRTIFFNQDQYHVLRRQREKLKKCSDFSTVLVIMWTFKPCFKQYDVFLAGHILGKTLFRQTHIRWTNFRQ